MTATTAGPVRGNGQRASERARFSSRRGSALRRHRQVPLVAVGVLLVIGCALVFTDASLQLGSREEVLVVARPLDAGQVLTSGDLRTAAVSTGSGVQAVPVGAESSVVGRRVAAPLVAGALLTTSAIGSAPPAGSGSDVVAVGLKPGAFPPGLAAGDRVQVVPVAASSGGGTGTAAGGSPVGATVLAVDAGSAASGGPTVVSLQVVAGDADEVAALAAAGQASLVEVGGGS